jgi:hypothetical protein
VTDSTVLGHLATMHGVRFDGVSFAEAKVWAKANPADPTPLSEVFTMLELEKAYATHDAEHVTSRPCPVRTGIERRRRDECELQHGLSG